MSKDWKTMELPASPDRPSASGASEMRLLPPDPRPSFPEGEIVHATTLTTKPSDSAKVTDAGELFYVLEGEGELWRATGDLEEVVPLRPGCCVSIPAGIEYQYIARRTPLKFLVATAPRFHERSWVKGERRYWDEHGNVVPRRSQRPGPSVPKDAGLGETKNLLRDAAPDYPAPDGSEIRLLPTFKEGGLAHCTLPAGKFSRPVRHRTVKEVWYVLSGRGRVWRGRADDEEDVVNVVPGTCLTIPTGVSFQFRAQDDGPVEIMIGTFPAWPGPNEAEPVEGRWT